MSDVELRLPADVHYVSLARLVVTAAARQAGMSDDRVEDLKIAVSEATTNAIVAHRRQGTELPVVLSFGPTAARTFEVTISDTGAGFEPLSPEAFQRRDPTTEGGLGVTIIRGLADDVEFVRGEGMRVHMRFEVDLGGGGGQARWRNGGQARSRNGNGSGTGYHS
ncbi:MAG TPA: ATP-binding protein [Egibacteraceae bacterium]|nr:ATP-binding protein [Actinomycetota bacterium]HWB72960.1 ATP-binding protein [Egibacteraceae bacterium]